MEMKQLPRETTLALIQEVEDSHAHFNSEAQKAFNASIELKERKRVLEVAKAKTSSSMAQTIIQDMIDELQESINQEEERQRFCENNRKYYSEIKNAVKKALEEF